jgi:serine/threonine protein kinase
MASIEGKILLNQFRVDAYVASGGMGTVFRVWDLKRNVPLAMKVLNTELADDPTLFRRFRREANALRKLAHPHIVPFYGLFQTPEFAFLLEAFIDGPTLKDLLRQRHGQPLPLSEVLTFLKAISSALGYAHANGVVHCDVKPGNVMIDQGGSVYLTDFGIARHAESSTTTLASAGTPAYMAPEQIRGDPVSPATDVYSLGILLFEMLTGQRPFRGTEAGTESVGPTTGERIRYAHLHLPAPDPRPLNPQIPEKLAKVVLQALEKDPARRFQNAPELFAAASMAIGLDAEQIPVRTQFEGEAGVPPSPIRPNINAKPSLALPRRSLGLWVVGGAALVLIALLMVLAFGGKPSGPASAEKANTNPTQMPATTTVPAFSPVVAEAQTPTAQTDATSTSIGKALSTSTGEDIIPEGGWCVYIIQKDHPASISEVIRQFTEADPQQLKSQVYEASSGIPWTVVFPNGWDIALPEGAMLGLNFISGVQDCVSHGGVVQPSLASIVDSTQAPSTWQQGRLVFSMQTNEKTNERGLYLLNLATDDQPEKLLVTSNKRYMGEIWSPDGSRIAFYDQVDKSLLWIEPVPGSSPKTVTKDCFQPSWLPDGITVFCRRTNGSTWLVDAQTGSGYAGPISEPKIALPDWSPLGDAVLYSTLEGNGGARIYLASTSGGAETQISGQGSENYAASWSHNGQWIAYQSNLGSDFSEIWVMDRNGNNAHRLTDSPSGSFARGPTWSPDDRWIAYVSGRGGTDWGEIYIIPTGGGEPIQVTKTSKRVYDWRVHWGP